MPDILLESVKDAGLESLEDHTIGPLDLTVGTRVPDRGPIDPDAVSSQKSRNFFPVKFVLWSVMI